MPDAAAGGPQFWLGCFYVLSAFLCAAVGISAYIAHNFKTNSFPYVTPIKRATLLSPCRPLLLPPSL